MKKTLQKLETIFGNRQAVLARELTKLHEEFIRGNISEWVPKSEFNQLNAEYTKLEKELETSQERLKSFAVEIAHLRQAQDKKPTLAQEAAPKVEVPEDPKKEPKQEIMSLENSKPQPADIVQKTEETKEEQ
jgi:16S rRNA C1402 (ribose-2'-O) methylase RsmI